MSSYYAGMICGMLSAGVLLYSLKRKRDKEGTVVYDERQLIARGRGFQYAYMILIALLMLDAGFEEQTERFVSPGVIPIAILLFSGLILFGYCLFHDAYWSFRGEKKEKRVLILWLVMALLSFAQSLNRILGGGFRINGRYSAPALLPLLLSIFFAGMRLIAVHQVRDEPPRGGAMKNLRLKAARAAKDLSQQELADLVGVSRQTVNAIEKGGL